MEGEVRVLDEKGRIVIPEQYRKAMGLQTGDNVRVFCKGGRIVLQKGRKYCVRCKEEILDVEYEVDGILFCDECVSWIQKATRVYREKNGI